MFFPVLPVDIDLGRGFTRNNHRNFHPNMLKTCPHCGSREEVEKLARSHFCSECGKRISPYERRDDETDTEATKTNQRTPDGSIESPPSSPEFESTHQTEGNSTSSARNRRSKPVWNRYINEPSQKFGGDEFATLADLFKGIGIIWGTTLLLGALVGGAIQQDPRPSDFLILTMLTNGATLVVCLYFTSWKYGHPVRKGLRFHAFPPLQGFLSVGLAVILGLGAVVMSSLFGTGESVISELMKKEGGPSIMLTVALVIPLFEEIYYRGFLYKVLERSANKWVAVGVVTFWFVGAHIPQYLSDPVSIPVIFVVGLAFTTQRAYADSILPYIISHTLYNGIVMMFAIL